MNRSFRQRGKGESTARYSSKQARVKRFKKRRQCISHGGSDAELGESHTRVVEKCKRKNVQPRREESEIKNSDPGSSGGPDEKRYPAKIYLGTTRL